MSQILGPGQTNNADAVLLEPGEYELVAKNVQTGGVELYFLAPDGVTWLPVADGKIEADGSIGGIIVPEETRGIRAVATTAGATAWMVRARD